MTFRNLRNLRGFFSDYYLGRVFGRGGGRGRRRTVSDRETDLAYARFRRVWARAAHPPDESTQFRERMVRPLVRDVLGFHLGAGQDGIHGLHASAEDEQQGRPPLLCCCTGAPDDAFDGGRGGSSPLRRLESVLASGGPRHGILVNAGSLRLIRRPGEGPRHAGLEINLLGLVENEDPESFAVFLRLLHQRSFVPGPEGRPPIDVVERESREHAEKVSDDLKGALFRAAESFAAGLLRDTVTRGVIADPTQLDEAAVRLHRDAALLGLYRILFILYAEARDSRLDSHLLYRNTYSAQGLLDEILRDPARDWPENRSSFWARLRALFRIYDQGLPPITTWENIPPRGGDLFSATTSEGRILDTATLPDRTVARLLVDLATTAPRQGVGRERVSFRELDIESLGAVYEGLLEFEPRVARETTIELRVQGRLFALSPAETVRLCEAKTLAVQGDLAIVAGTVAERLHPDGLSDDETADSESADEDDDEEADEDEAGDSGDEGGEKGVKRGAVARLVRRLEPGTFHFVPGTSRKGSGSFYTPRLLVNDLVRHALGSVVEGKTAAQIESLRVLDPACGSAHFLVEAMRFLGRALHRAYVVDLLGRPPPAFRSTLQQPWDDQWQATDEEARAANSEARAWCKRRIAERCLFGVDLNPTAVTLARVALWIESVAGDRPLSYFEHHVRCGNALLGTWEDRLGQSPLPERGSSEVAQLGLFQQVVRRAIADAARLRRMIDAVTPEDLRQEGVEPESVEEQRFKDAQRRRAESLLEGAHVLFDLRSASLFLPAIWGEWAILCAAVEDPASLRRHIASRPWADEFTRICERERFFHWELEFPEVFLDPDRPGFDAVLGNPPWDKVLPSRLEFYGRQDVLIRAFKGNDLDRRIAELHASDPGLAERFADYRARTTTVGQHLRRGGDFAWSEARTAAAHEDLSKYFLDRAARLTAIGGRVGMVVPSVVYNGDGCVGLRRFLLTGASIERFYGFENRRKIFPIDSRYKFVSLVFRRGSPAGATFDATFMRHDLGELMESGRVPWIVRVTREEIERLSPDTLAFLEYRSARDQEIVAKMHRGKTTLGAVGPGAWGAQLFTDLAHVQIYNVARDKDLWTDPKTGRLHSPESILGAEPSDLHETLRRMRERGFWPVFEGKHTDHYLVGRKKVRWWLSVEQAKRKYDREPRPVATLVFRETARNTDERTSIAAVLPAESAASHKLTGVLSEYVAAERALTVLNSLCFDFALRLRTAGTNISFTYIKPVAVPPATVVNTLPTIPTILTWERALDHITCDEDLWPLLWRANRAVAEAYGLDEDDFEHILASFPVMARKRPAFVAYLREQLAAWRAENGAVPEESRGGTGGANLAAER